MQVIDLNKAELNMVADHLGHSLKIHTTVYRMQQNAIERSKVARILTLLEDGATEKIKQAEMKDLQDIPLTDLGSEK